MIYEAKTRELGILEAKVNLGNLCPFLAQCRGWQYCGSIFKFNLHQAYSLLIDVNKHLKNFFLKKNNFSSVAGQKTESGGQNQEKMVIFYTFSTY